MDFAQSNLMDDYYLEQEREEQRLEEAYKVIMDRYDLTYEEAIEKYTQLRYDQQQN